MLATRAASRSACSRRHKPPRPRVPCRSAAGRHRARRRTARLLSGDLGGLLRVGFLQFGRGEWVCSSTRVSARRSSSATTAGAGRRPAPSWCSRRPRSRPPGAPGAVARASSRRRRAPCAPRVTRSAAGASDSSSVRSAAVSSRAWAPARRPRRPRAASEPTSSSAAVTCSAADFHSPVGRPVAVKYRAIFGVDAIDSSGSSPEAPASVSPAATSSARDSASQPERFTASVEPDCSTRWACHSSVSSGLGEHRLHPIVRLVAGQLLTLRLDDVELGLGLLVEALAIHETVRPGADLGLDLRADVGVWRA